MWPAITTNSTGIHHRDAKAPNSNMIRVPSFFVNHEI
jgi:hypothetical protein